MLIYEKGTGDERHLYGTLNNVPSDDDSRLEYTGFVPTFDGQYFDSGNGGIVNKDGVALKVFVSDTHQIIPPETEDDILSNECDITSFKIGRTAGTIDGTNITVTVSASKDITKLTPTIVTSGGATITPEGEQDFTNSVTYTVTAEDGTTTKTYKVTVTKETA